MKLKIGEIEIEATSLDEIKTLLEMAASVPTLTNKGVSNAASDNTARGGKGPFELAYNDKTGKQLRLSLDERVEIEQGVVDREGVAKRRLDTLGVGTVSIVTDGETNIPDDDNKELY